MEGLICYFLELSHPSCLALYMGTQPDIQAFRLELGLYITGSSGSQIFWFRQELHCRLSCSSDCGRQVEGFLCFHNCVNQSLIIYTFLHIYTNSISLVSLEVKWNEVTQTCPILCHQMNYTVHGILQARILKWVAFPFSRTSSQPTDRTRSPALQADSLPAEPPGKPSHREDWEIQRIK